MSTGPVLITKKEGTDTIQPVINVKISENGRMLELHIPETKLHLITKPEEIHKDDGIYLVFRSDAEINKPRIDVLFDDRPVGSVSVTTIINTATGNPLHYDVQGGYVTAAKSFSKLSIKMAFLAMHADTPAITHVAVFFPN